MTFEEIERRRNLVREAGDQLAARKKALREAQAEYAEEVAREKGIIFNETKVKVRVRFDPDEPPERAWAGPFMVTGLYDWYRDKPYYQIARIKKDGTPSARSAGFHGVSLNRIEVAEE